MGWERGGGKGTSALLNSGELRAVDEECLYCKHQQPSSRHPGHSRGGARALGKHLYFQGVEDGQCKQGAQDRFRLEVAALLLSWAVL